MNKLPLALLIIFTLGSAIHAQDVASPQSSPPEVKIEPLTPDEVIKLVQIISLELEVKLHVMAPTPERARANPSAKLAQLYKEAAASPRLTRHLLGQRIETYLKNQNSARSAPQASQVANEASVELLHLLAAQNAAIIEQNARMIVLLERLTRGR